MAKMSFWPQKVGVLWWYGQTDKQTNTKMDIADSRLKWPQGQFGEKLYFLIPKPWVYWQLCLLSFVFYWRFESSNWIGFILFNLFSWASTAVTKGCIFFALQKMHSHILWQNALQTKCSWGQEHFARRAFCQRIWESIFERPREHSLKNALLHTFKDAPLVNCSSKRAFCQDSIL